MSGLQMTLYIILNQYTQRRKKSTRRWLDKIRPSSKRINNKIVQIQQWAAGREVENAKGRE